MSTAEQRARHFLDHEREFRLGVLPTEQPHPRTARLSDTIRGDTAAGVRLLQAVDRDLPPVVHRVLAGPEFERLVAQLLSALEEGRHIYLTGCGATGRLCILLESAWRRFWRQAPNALTRRWPGASEAVRSVMTGGDYALVRSVEFFEDFMSFGRHQLAEAGVHAGDVVVAVSEGGETSSVIGTVWQGVEAGAHVFFVFNNPADILDRHVERSRAVIRDARVVKLDLASGPMAIAGSTRMQATTIELMVLGSALETALGRLAAKGGVPLSDSNASMPDAPTRERAFIRLLDDLASPATVRALSDWVEIEERVYAERGAVTYLADTFLLDIFTDTTERAPTFMLPPFRRSDDTVSPRSWAFVKTPCRPTPAAWRTVLEHEPRCLDWTRETYAQLGASDRICQNPPAIRAEDLRCFAIGNEDDPSRYAASADTAVVVLNAQETGSFHAPGDGLGANASRLGAPFPHRMAVSIGAMPPQKAGFEAAIHVACTIPVSPLCLWEHLAVKLAFNTVSTATMARLGRVDGNWMVHVETSNKKLIDRGTRIVMAFTGLDYEAACHALHETIDDLQSSIPAGRERPSPVAVTIETLRARKKKSSSA